MTKGMSLQRQRVLPRQKSRLEFRSRQSVLLCYWLIPKSNANLRLVEDLEHNETENNNGFSSNSLYPLRLMARGEYSDSIVIPVEIPSLPRPRISADILFSAEMFFLLVSRSFKSELLQYNFLHLDPAAFGFCQG
ncbi:hypothetical protein V6N13_065774 [Hibiscus sabdariffa]